MELHILQRLPDASPPEKAPPHSTFASPVVNLSSRAIPLNRIQILQRSRKMAIIPQVKHKSQLLRIIATDPTVGIKVDQRLNNERVLSLILAMAPSLNNRSHQSRAR